MESEPSRLRFYRDLQRAAYESASGFFFSVITLDVADNSAFISM
jgi:hypothetical protein